MVDLTRRWFLGGAISLAAVTVSSAPKIIGNLPQIWADGVHDDTYGIGALLRVEPVVFPKERLTIDDHKGITFHRGLFRISQTLEIPDECNLTLDHPTFCGPDLDPSWPFFKAGGPNTRKFAGIDASAFSSVTFQHKPSHGPLVNFPEDEDDVIQHWVTEANGDIHWKAA